MKYRTHDDYITERLRQEPDFAVEYLNTALEAYFEDFNRKALALALKRLILAGGSIKKFSETANINREHLYRLFNTQSVPSIDTLSKILKALGYQIEVKQVKRNLKSA